jgi:BASS family bile acid:Na+ symporter
MSELYLRYEYYFAAVQLATAMFGMGVRLQVRDFIAVFRVPGAFLLGMGAQLVLVPLLAMSVGRLLDAPSGIAVGLILVAAVPGGTMSNVITFFAKGNIALSIALTAVTTLLCLVTTPLILRGLTGEALPGDFTMPMAAIAFDISVCLLLPLSLGMLAGTALPRWRDPLSTWAIRASLLVILLMVIGASSAGRIDPASQGVVAIVAMLLFAGLAQLSTLLLGRLRGLSSADVTAIAIEVTVRNTNLAVLIKASLFPVSAAADPVADGVLYVALLYGGAAGPVALPLIFGHRRYVHRAA